MSGHPNWTDADGMNASSPLPRVVVLGAGVAGLEAAFLLESRLSGRVDLQVVYEHDEFVLRPNLVYVPFGADRADSRLWVGETLARKAITGHMGRVDGVDADIGRVHLAGGRQLPYEHLVIATGAAPWMRAVPGLQEHAASIWGAAEMLTLREHFMHLRGRAREGSRQRVLFVVPRHNRWSPPVYEVALMLDTWLRRERARDHVDLGFVTHEASFVEAAGPRMHEIIERQFTERGIVARASERLVEVRTHEAFFADGSVEPFDLLVTAPPHRAAVRYEGLPGDEHGFVRVESATRQVAGHPEIYAPGDAGDFPLKDAFLALLQADAAADHIAAVLTRREVKRPFEPVSAQIIEMLDTAAFAQLPLELTGDADHPVRLRRGGGAEYKAGVSPRWRAGKRMFSSYLLTRFAAAEPFRTGPGWRFMDLGARAMTDVLAD
jgi:sulfide:quinone oxidoreductase